MDLITDIIITKIMDLILAFFITGIFLLLILLPISLILLPILLYFREKFYFHPIYYEFNSNEFFQKYSVKEYYYKSCRYWIINSRNKCEKTLFYLHGNAGNITFRQEIISKLSDNLDCNIVIIDYLCQNKSLSSNTLIQTGIDIIKNLDLKAENTILFGESIGCAIALEIAKRLKFKNVICMVGFSSMRDMIRHLLGKIGIFLGLFIGELDNEKIIKENKMNILLLNSKSDEIIPFKQTEKLKKLPGVELIEIFGKHNEPEISSETFNYIKQKYEI